jgi:hypothetical protein
MGSRQGTSSHNKDGSIRPMSDRAGPDNWREDAYCARVDPDLWFPEKGGGNWNARAAVAICRDKCLVREECLTYALRMDETDGIFGGFPPRARRPFAVMVRAGATARDVAITAIHGTEVLRRWSA